MVSEPTSSLEGRLQPPLRAVEDQMAAEALFREARKRRQVRWLIGVAALVIVIGTVIGTIYGESGGTAAKKPVSGGVGLGALHVFREASASMEPTLDIGDRVEVTTDLGRLRRGDVVLFALPSQVHTPVNKAFKRIIGLPGETISSSGSTIVVNGSPLSEPYLASSQGPGAAVSTQVIPANEYFVLGDNREDSLDSRYFGPIPLTSIVGVATRIAAPSSRSGSIAGS